MTNKLASGLISAASAAAVIALTSHGALAQKVYDTGASATQIKSVKYPGGLTGPKTTFVTYDDAYSPPKTVEQTRKLIESDEVFLIFNALGTPTQTAVQKYQNAKKVPQLFVATGASKWNDPKDFPWT